MKIAQLSPLWESVPPKTYGGTELVVHMLCQEMTALGHEVTLFACGGSQTDAKLDAITRAPMREAKVGLPFLYELEAVAKVIDNWQEFDIIHNHMGPHILPFASMINVPIVTTAHNALLNKEEADFYKKYSKNCPLISISDSQRKFAPHLNYISTVYNGIYVDRYKFEPKPNEENPYLIFLGRISVEKGAHLAIQLAKATGHKLIMAGKVDPNDQEYYESSIKHLIDNKQIIYIGEVGHDAKNELLKGALATIHPVTWPEPFGLVMAESMACGTPVLALNQGSIPEVIKDGVTGYIENSIDKLIERVKDIPLIDRKACRTWVEQNFSAQRMTHNYLEVYRKIIDPKPVEIDFNIGISSLNIKKK